MTNKLVVIINTLKVPKIKEVLLYEMKIFVPNYSCLQNPWLGGYRPPIPVLSVLNWICWTPPPSNKIPGYATGQLSNFSYLPDQQNLTVTWYPQGECGNFQSDSRNRRCRVKTGSCVNTSPEVTEAQITNVMFTYGEIKKIHHEVWSHVYRFKVKRGVRLVDNSLRNTFHRI